MYAHIVLLYKGGIAGHKHVMANRLTSFLTHSSLGLYVINCISFSMIFISDDV